MKNRSILVTVWVASLCVLAFAQTEKDLSPHTVATAKAVAATVFAVNCGGSSYTSSDGTNYAADTGYSGGSTYSNTASISGTIDDTLYNSERYGNSTYTVAVPNSLYLVTLYFAETFHTAAGSRSFDVLMEGTEYISDLDIYAEAGGNAAYVVETYVTVSDGELNIEFNTNLENAKINAIKVTLAGLGAAFNYSPATPRSGQAVTFDASASADSDGTITAYSWGFGDGASSTGKTTTHTYSTAGDYRVTLTITDNEGNTASVTKTVTVYSDSEPRPFMEYIKPRPITCNLSYETWGVNGVLPRDLCNGIESARGAGIGPEYYYWDAQIIRAQDGKYHMFMSTWSGTESFNPGWLQSDAYHAISTQGVLGPYERQGYVYNENGSHKGHNVSALELQDGTYAVVISETRPFTIYTSASLDGPWTSCQPQLGLYQSNVSLFQRHDGRFQIVQRNGYIAIADSLCGNYVQQTPTTSYPTRDGNSIYPRRTSIPGVDNPTFDWEEDPHIWRSGGVYHVIYSGSGDRVGYHLYSKDGINDWQDNGYAWSPREWKRIFCFEDGTCNQWYKMERPGVVLEDGHPTHLTWAVSDVDKDNQIPGGSNHGSKIIVIPFDGEAFDADFGGAVANTNTSHGN